MISRPTFNLLTFHDAPVLRRELCSLELHLWLKGTNWLGGRGREGFLDELEKDKGIRKPKNKTAPRRRTMSNQNRWTGAAVGILMGVLFSAAVVLAGSLEPSVGPNAPGSQMYTLDDIYYRIALGPEFFGIKKTAFTEPSSGPTAGTKHSLNEIYDMLGWRAPVPKTGQTPWVPINPAPPGSDGALAKGVAKPIPRFSVDIMGRVTDNLTGLIWLKQANCLGVKTWGEALVAVATLKSGHCGLSDGSSVGDWRLPNVRELQSLIDFAYFDPAISNAAGTGPYNGDTFTGGQTTAYYWSSTTYAQNTGNAWGVNLNRGLVVPDDKGIAHDVLAVLSPPS
jgi:hypothetical protein